MISHYLKIALRSLKKNKFYSILSISGFAVGFAVCIIIGLYAYSEFTTDTDFKNHERIFRVLDTKSRFIWGETTNKISAVMDFKFGETLKDNYPGIEEIAPYQMIDLEKKSMIAEGNVYTIRNHLTTSNEMFDLLSLKIINNEGEKPFVSGNSVVLTESLAKRIFGTEDPLGKAVVFAWMRDFDLKVSAIVEDLPSNSSFNDIDIFLNSNGQLSGEMSSKGVSIKPANFYLKLKEGVNPEQFTRKVNSTLAGHHKIHHEIVLQKISDIYMHSDNIENSYNAKGNSKLIYLLISVAILIFILSLINFINYSIAQYQTQIKNIGIRKTNGATLQNIFRYFMSESFVGITIAAVFSLFIAVLLTPFSNQLLGKKFDVSILFQPIPFSVFMAVFVIVVLINTILPQIGLLRFNLARYRKGGYSNNRKNHTAGALSILQFSIAIGLLVSLVFINKQVNFAKNDNLGFQKENILYVSLGENSKSATTLKSEINRLPFVEKSTLSTRTIGTPTSRAGVSSQSKHIEKERITHDFLFADLDFFETYGIKIDHNWTKIDGLRDRMCFINESAIREHSWESIEDKRFDNFGGYDITGVVKDFKFSTTHTLTKPTSIVFDERIFNESPERLFLSIRLSKGILSEQIAQLRKTWNSIITDRPMEITFLDEQLNAMYAKDEQLGKAISAFSIVALILVMLGILGQVFQIGINKTKEIGIRKVNGATLLDIFRIINYRFVIWVLAAFIIASPVAYKLMQRWLESFAYKTTLDWWVFALTGLGTFSFVVTIVTLQSWNIATRNPVDALRYE